MDQSACFFGENRKSVGNTVVVPAKEHRDAAAEDVESGFLLFDHEQTAFPETGFPGDFGLLRGEEVRESGCSHVYLWAGYFLPED